MQVLYISLEMGNLGQLNIFVQEFVGINARNILLAFYSSGEEWAKGAQRSCIWPLWIQIPPQVWAWDTGVSKRWSLVSATVSAEGTNIEDQ